MNNYILNLLNIKDKNIYICEKIDEKIIKAKNDKVIYGTLTYKPEYCPRCGVINNSNDDIIKWGFKLCKINITRVRLCKKSNPNYNKLKTYWKLILKNKNDLSEDKKYSKHFRKEISQIDIVNYLINTNKELKETYRHFTARIFLIKGIVKG